MSKTIILWFRNDLRVTDHPALTAAIQAADYIVPLFILDSAILKSDHASANRNRFLLESLTDLQHSLQSKGADLVVRDGRPEVELVALAHEVAAEAVYYTADYTPYAITRDKLVKTELEKTGIAFRSFGGRLAVDHLQELHTKAQTTHKIFTPFWKNWQQVRRRPLAPSIGRFSLPNGIKGSQLPSIASVTSSKDLSPRVITGGETAGQALLSDWLMKGVQHYHEQHNDMAANGTSHLSAHLHFGTVSVREIEERLPPGAGPEAFHRQLAWRDFYHYVLFHFPANLQQEFQEPMRALQWGSDITLLQVWQRGQTGYPIVDAAMRQLNQEGWMHNRARLIVGSFLTKDLWLDWRLGEAYFMRMLVDGDNANNNGNWQWIASVGVDPAPVFRRLYNPASQQKNYDPTGAYVRRYVPELAKVPDDFLAEPWKMSLEMQAAIGCKIGVNYPAPIVDHTQARLAALDRYREARDNAKKA